MTSFGSSMLRKRCASFSPAFCRAERCSSYTGFHLPKSATFMTNQHVHDRMLSLPCLFYRLGKMSQRRLKYCTAFSCFFVAAFVLNVPRLLRFPVLGFFFREYSRYLPDLSFLITFHRIFADR